MSTGIECIQYTHEMKNDNIFHADVLSWIKKRKYIGVKKSNIKYMQNETQNYRI